MVETYKRTSNPMMNRPVVKAELVEWMRSSQTQITGELAEVLKFAKENNIPVIPHETVIYFQMLLSLLQPKRILEIGTAIGFSALVMAQEVPNAEIVTIDRNPEMIELAKKNLDKYDHRKQIILKEGDAAEVLRELSAPFDVIFMDSAKSKYIEFLPIALDLLSENGVILMDDIFQGGDVARPILEVRRGQRTIYKGLQRLFDATLTHPDLTTSLVPLGDGLLMIRKNTENIVL